VVRDATAELYAALTGLCSERPPGREELYRLVNETIVPHADFERMARWVMGKYWHRASAQQRSEFSNEFKWLLIRTYATAVQGTSPENIVYLPARKSTSPDRAVVRTEVHAAGAEVVPIHYYMRMREGRWLVYDVKIEGISLLTNYRVSFSAEIRHSGVQALIDHLKQKNQQLRTSMEPLKLAVAGGC
jgi:phospholipid transport system substrate-binding protein